MKSKTKITIAKCAVSAGLVGLFGSLIMYNSKPLKEPRPEDFKQQITYAFIPEFGFSRLYDLDNDTIVDAIIKEGQGFSSHIAEGYDDQARSIAHRARWTTVLTPEMREEATKLHKATRDAAYQISKDKYQTRERK